MLALLHPGRRAAWPGRLFTNFLHCRRCLSTSGDATKDALRNLLRETAQPVAVVTSFYPFDGSLDDSQHSKFHGATLSSFTSIALDPHPLVAFSLRIPSRMATSLKARMQQQLPGSASSPSLRFARADLFPEPFRITPHTLTEEGLPVLTGALGALSCSLVSCTPLHDLCDSGFNPAEIEAIKSDGELISELFISRVIRVESAGTLASSKDVLPLLYHHRRYATARPLDTIPKQKPSTVS
ncbi:flavin reductase like domain-containing protein [Phellopilus nigrolimitatus]|nr:flavin reductase like domain-containing protein [Phellopilus nigrolimitatus]